MDDSNFTPEVGFSQGLLSFNALSLYHRSEKKLLGSECPFFLFPCSSSIAVYIYIYVYLYKYTYSIVILQMEVFKALLPWGQFWHLAPFCVQLAKFIHKIFAKFLRKISKYSWCLKNSSPLIISFWGNLSYLCSWLELKDFLGVCY